jgi:hypothetical protein
MNRVMPLLNSWIRKPSALGAALIAPALCLCLSGCHLFPRKQGPVVLDIRAKTYSNQNQSVKRVLLLPFINKSEYEERADSVAAEFGRALSERGLYEVVMLPPEDEELVEALRPFSTGRISASLLIDLGTCYHVDAVVVGCLKTFEPYSPPVISMKADLISINNGATLRTVSGVLDARDAMVVRDVKNYFQTECAHQDSLFEWRRVTYSPEMYTRYACHRFVDALYPETR